ncbi:MAG: MBL fold metallo-hydrolase [Bacteroidales bacterium]
MVLKVVDSGSKANCFILEGRSSTLIIECGSSFRRMSEAINFEIDRVDGCLVSHEHRDHCKHAGKYAKRGIKIYGSNETIQDIKAYTEMDSPYFNVLRAKEEIKIGEFLIKPFDVKHDAKEPFGYLIYHPEAGNILFAIDTYYIPYRFKAIDYLMIEANYKQSIVDSNVQQGYVHPIVRNRLLRGHMEIETLGDMLRANNTNSLKKTILLHLSDKNSDPPAFEKYISRITGVPTISAKRDVIVNL